MNHICHVCGSAPILSTSQVPRITRAAQRCWRRRDRITVLFESSGHVLVQHHGYQGLTRNTFLSCSGLQLTYVTLGDSDVHPPIFSECRLGCAHRLTFQGFGVCRRPPRVGARMPFPALPREVLSAGPALQLGSRCYPLRRGRRTRR